MKYIKKVSAVEIPEINGSVVDTLNVTDKTTNAPSIRLFEETVTEINKLLGTHIIKQNTKIPGGNNSTEMELYTESDLKTILGLESITTDRLVVYSQNGDYNANDTQIIATYFKNNSLYVVFNKTNNAHMRINSLLVYRK